MNKLEQEKDVDHETVLIWGWGAGTDGQLGNGTLEDQLLPQTIRLALDSSHDFTAAAAATNMEVSPFASSSPSPPMISHIACGGAHAIALTASGRVLTWGRDTHGQLGHGHLQSCSQPKPVKLLERFSVSYVSAGWNHSGFVTDTGQLLTCGDGSFGQLGHGDYQSQYSPIEVVFFASKHVEQIACGMRHSLVLVKGPFEDSVYGFGSGRHGQLGLPLKGSSRLFNLPQIVIGLENEMIDNISANGDRSAALSVNKQLYSWGKAFAGKQNDYLPRKIASHLKFSQVALGWKHALLLTDDGEVYMLGGNLHGKLSGSTHVKAEQEATVSSTLCAQSDEEVSMVYLMERVPGLDGQKVLDIAAGAEHSALVTENGEVMTWGWGEHGQLGLGNICDQTRPQLVNIGRSGDCSVRPRLRVYCGSGFTFAVENFS